MTITHDLLDKIESQEVMRNFSEQNPLVLELIHATRKTLMPRRPKREKSVASQTSLVFCTRCCARITGRTRKHKAAKCDSCADYLNAHRSVPRAKRPKATKPTKPKPKTKVKKILPVEDDQPQTPPLTKLAQTLRAKHF